MFFALTERRTQAAFELDAFAVKNIAIVLQNAIAEGGGF